MISQRPPRTVNAGTGAKVQRRGIGESNHALNRGIDFSSLYFLVCFLDHVQYPVFVSLCMHEQWCITTSSQKSINQKQSVAIEARNSPHSKIQAL